MSSLDAMPAVGRPPRVRAVPGKACTWEWGVEDACDLASAYLKPLQDWQADVLGCWLAEGEDGRYACDTCGLLVPRQNGKTELLANRILFGMLFGNGGAGENIAYSAHRVDTTLEMFDRLVEVFGDKRKPPSEWLFPDLHELVDEDQMVFTNGHQRIGLKNGSVVTFNSRSKGNRRGFTVDVQIYDEAGFLTDEQLSASKSTNSAAPHGNPQTIYAGTPPSEQGLTAEPFARVRDRATSGVGSACWHEWSVDEARPEVLSDRNVWAECNPALGTHLLAQAVESEFMAMSAEKFAIERLCWWPPTAAPHVIPREKWDASALALPDDAEVERRCFGVKFAPDGLQLCVSVGLRLPDGSVHVELAENRNTLEGIQWLVDALVGAREETALVAIDGRSGAENLAGALERAGFPKKGIHVMSSSEVVASTAMLTSMLVDGKLTHFADDALDASARAATRRRIGTEGFGFGGDSCAIESACAACWAAVTTKRNPRRKQLIG